MLSSRNVLITLALLLLSVPVLAADMSPVGTWKTIDDKTGEAKSIVQITEHNGVLEGTILKVLKSDDGPHPLCKECDGKRHNQPIEGMNFMWGLTRDDDVWDGGKILDPKTGKIYKAKVQVIDGGRNLKVRGYIGFALLGRTQVWHRVETPKPAQQVMMHPTPASSSAMAPAGDGGMQH